MKENERRKKERRKRVIKEETKRLKGQNERKVPKIPTRKNE